MSSKLPNESTMRGLAGRVFVSYSAVVKWRKDYKGGDNPFPSPTGKKWEDHSHKPSYTFDNEQFDQWHKKMEETKWIKQSHPRYGT